MAFRSPTGGGGRGLCTRWSGRRDSRQQRFCGCWNTKKIIIVIPIAIRIVTLTLIVILTLIIVLVTILMIMLVILLILIFLVTILMIMLVILLILIIVVLILIILIIILAILVIIVILAIFPLLLVFSGSRGVCALCRPLGADPPPSRPGRLGAAGSAAEPHVGVPLVPRSAAAAGCEQPGEVSPSTSL